MSKKIILSLILSYSVDSFPNVDSRVLNILNDKIEPAISCNLEENKNFNSCIEALCGKAENNKTYQNLFDGITSDAETIEGPELVQFKSNIASYLDISLKGTERSLNDYKDPATLAKTLIEPDMASTHKILAISSALALLDFEKIIKESSLSSHHLVVSVDDEELKKGLGAKAAQAPIYKELLNNPDLQISMFAQNYGWTLTNQSRYPNLSLKEVIQKELVQFNALMAKLQKETPKAYELFKSSAIINQKILDKILKEENPSESLQVDFFDSVVNARLMVKYITQGAPEFNKLKVTTLGNLYSENELRLRLMLNRILTSELKQKDEVLKAKLNHCVAIFQKNQLALPTNSEKNEFTKTANEVRSTVRQKISANLSKETAIALSTPLEKIFFDFPSTKAESSFLIQEQLNALINDQNEMEKKYKGEDKNVNPEDLKLAAIHSFMNLTSDNFASDLKDMCDEFEVPSLNDASYNLGSGKILVSWMSIKKPDMGKAVLTHELGHALSTILRSTPISEHSAMKFKSARECLSLRQPSEESTAEMLNYKNVRGNTVTVDYQISQYAEEDWADLVAAKFAPDNTPNKGCFLIGEKDDNYSSNNLSPLDASDTHSPEIFRLLHIEYLKKKTLPASCVESMSMEEKKKVMVDCLI